MVWEEKMVDVFKRENITKILRSLIKSTIVLVVLWLIRTFLLILPIKIEIPNISLPFSIIENLVIDVLILFIVLKFVRDISLPLKNLLVSSLEIRKIILNFIYLAALVIAYFTFLPLVETIIPEFRWIYSLIFLVITIYPILNLTVAFYRSIDKWTNIISKKLIKPNLEHEKPHKCQSCGASTADYANYCTSCGAKIK